jgi:hypothetical protein
MRSLSSAAFTLWHDRLVDLLVSGRQNRIYTAISTRNVRELELAASFSMSVTYELSAHYEGTETAAEDRLPGYGLTSDGLFFQFLVPAPEDDARRSLGASEQIVRFLDPEGWRGIGSPPRRPQPGYVLVGTYDVSRLDVSVDLAENHVFLIGPSRSGRTTLLEQFAIQLADEVGGKVGLLSLRANPEAPSAVPSVTQLEPADVIELNKLREREERESFRRERDLVVLPDGRIVLLVDDAYPVESMPGGFELNTALAELHEKSTIRVIATSKAQAISKCTLTNNLKTSGPPST